MKNKGKTIDEIIDMLAAPGISWTHDQLDGTSFIEGELNGIAKDKAEAKAAISALIDELGERVIGADEYEAGMQGDDKLMTRHADFVRAEQRKRLEEFKGEMGL